MENNKIAIIDGELFINGKFKKGSIFIENNKIKRVVQKKVDRERLSGYYVIDAADCYVSYGFIDPHVHFRTPGQEYKEDWESGSKAAIKGGYTFVIDMPNNSPPAIDEETLTSKNDRALKTKINYGFYIGLTDENAKNIKNIYNRLKNKIPIYGVKVFLGSSTGSLLIKDLKSINLSLKTGLINLFHCEDEEVLSEYKHIKYDSVLDHNDIRPPAAEISAFKKIIKQSLNIKNKARIYICHVSSENLLRMIKRYKNRGFNIINEVTPHHLYFNLSNIEKSNVFKVNPPIRDKKNVDYLRERFNKSDFDIIGTDHAPHLLKEKNSGNPPSGLPGLEYAFYALHYLYEKNVLSVKKIFSLLTSGYKIFNIKKRGEIKPGNFADLTIVKKQVFTIRTEDNKTKADFCPYEGLITNATIDTVIVNGKILLKNNEFIEDDEFTEEETGETPRLEFT